MTTREQLYEAGWVVSIQDDGSLQIQGHSQRSELVIQPGGGNNSLVLRQIRRRYLPHVMPIDRSYAEPPRS